MANVANRMTWTVAPDAYLVLDQYLNQRIGNCSTYQNGPLTPYLYATLVDWSKVAAHVQDDTTAEATRPDLTVRPAVLKTSLVCNSLLYRRRTKVVNIIPKLHRCKPKFSPIPYSSSTHAKRNPRPMMMP